mmetsp:Transcript_102382/g.256535  ORF Transcript_102382/g.256535 Transcript_102382/m.256535 type:complete len:236 (-) Transcript_102382:436-1143(-)
MKAITDKSAILGRNSISKWLSCQTSKNACPKFLLGAPKCKSTTLCTISATWFTKTMVCSFSTSVAMWKWRISQNPKIASTLEPGMLAMPWESSLSKFSAIMLTPASPKPNASKEPNLMIVFSSIFVSRVVFLRSRSFSRRCLLLAFLDLGRNSSMPARCPEAGSGPASLIAYKGSRRINSTLLIIRSIGCSTRLSTSLLKRSAPIAKTMTTSTVCRMPMAASHLIFLVTSKIKMN